MSDLWNIQVQHTQINLAELCQRWLYASEEDTETEAIYRPATYTLPPSRGRSGFELRADGSCLVFHIARTDGIGEEEGRWALEDDRRLVIRLNVDAAPEEIVLQIRGVSSERLVIEKSR